jgi:hypothetical protein
VQIVAERKAEQRRQFSPGEIDVIVEQKNTKYWPDLYALK